MKFLDGYKTYIAGLLPLAMALIESVLGIDVPGFDMGLTESLIAALGAFGVRQAIAKNGNGV